MLSTSRLFFFNDTATTEIYTLSLHDALPIWAASPSAPGSRSGTPRPCRPCGSSRRSARPPRARSRDRGRGPCARPRSEEHTSELQSRQYLVCRLLLEKKNTTSSHVLH